MVVVVVSLASFLCLHTETLVEAAFVDMPEEEAVAFALEILS